MTERWAKHREDTLRRMYAAGCTDEEIGLALQVSPHAVSGKRWRIGLVTKRGTGSGYDAAMYRHDRARRTAERKAAREESS